MTDAELQVCLQGLCALQSGNYRLAGSGEATYQAANKTADISELKKRILDSILGRKITIGSTEEQTKTLG